MTHKSVREYNIAWKEIVRNLCQIIWQMLDALILVVHGSVLLYSYI